ncbi:tRNA (adenosine(37)-N6)-threonylcarbamoyltransferase complex dimerization subunit type 1 TsaB [Fictibacillus aquaticus]|uniref:tRNA (Adenosine(37)-N6)-threonylcarbamoyltransferase complex dimerization subunit type 1 TsaB n=1 Tax=Fictibacillus aquaticus TaxID=2021314 RepID=A0A235F5D6_9BACL|nr:tRNA (adenosine(37)-N6)-threonylcarbamoyltransferase complex dimerization subunit type 1 TsaB [Fictibacillus aquaticus]OYD56404.1 tRNA (adenosine(37)-N6)-threonylcarbamoyltransferase complex dimerization subunit type 1 TsaB [Fictibacillus aquaticus]
MNVLAIDTSNLVMGISVLKDGIVTGEIITNLKKNHSIRLMRAVDELMKETGTAPADLDRIAVAQGPGSYTGVRIGVTVAKTLAWTLKKELVGVSSLEVLAQNGKYFDGLVVPLFDARRTQLFTGLYGREDGEFKNLAADRIILRAEWLEVLKTYNRRVLFIGTDLPLHQEAIADAMGDLAVFGTAGDNIPKPSELARLGMEKDPEADVHAFVPSYLQLAEAEVNWLKAQNKQV